MYFGKTDEDERWIKEDADKELRRAHTERPVPKYHPCARGI